MTNTILSEIIKEVKEKGYHYVLHDALKAAFGCEGREDPCTEEGLLDWAIDNNIMFEYKVLGQFKVVRFWGGRGDRKIQRLATGSHYPHLRESDEG